MRLTLSSGIRRLSREQGKTPRWVARGAEGDVSVIGPVGLRGDVLMSERCGDRAPSPWGACRSLRHPSKIVQKVVFSYAADVVTGATRPLSTSASYR